MNNQHFFFIVMDTIVMDTISILKMLQSFYMKVSTAKFPWRSFRSKEVLFIMNI